MTSDSYHLLDEFQKTRGDRKKTIPEACKEAGVSSGTIWGVQAGVRSFSRRSVTKINNWINGIPTPRLLARDMPLPHCSRCLNEQVSNVEDSFCKKCKAIKLKEWKIKNADHVRAYDRKIAAKKNLTTRAKNPEKYKARSLVNSAIASGRLVRESCVRCGEAKTHGHHEDYSKPLEVVWLCKPCHDERHRELRNA